MQLGPLPSTYVNFLCIWETFRQLLTICSAARKSSAAQKVEGKSFGIRPSLKFCSVSVRQKDLPSTFVKFLCSREICHLPSTLSAARKPSIKFRQFSVRLKYRPSTSVNETKVELKVDGRSTGCTSSLQILTESLPPARKIDRN